MTSSEASAAPEAAASSAPSPWWGDYTLDVGAGGRWLLGPMTLLLIHARHEWRVYHDASGDPMDERIAIDVSVSAETLQQEAEANDALSVMRHAFHEAATEVRLTPALADRPVIVRPEHPLSVPSGETVTLFVSTPLWVQIGVGEGTSPVQDVPTLRLSDTWFGASTREGELCYAGKTAGRLELDNLPKRQYRAITPVRVQNKGADALPVERIQVPTPHLRLFTTDDGLLWTQGLTLRREKGDTGASVDVDDRPPDVPGAAPLTDPRESSKNGLFVSTFRTFSSLFS